MRFLRIKLFLSIFLLICLPFLFLAPIKSASDGFLKWPNQPVGKHEDMDIYDYLLPSENSKIREGPITYIMLHFISNVKEKPHNPYVVEDVYNILKTNRVSSHYLIDRNGKVYRLVPEDRVAFHAGSILNVGFSALGKSVNEQSIGIELLAIGAKEEMTEYMDENIYHFIHYKHIGYTDEQYESLNKLLQQIMKRYPRVSREHIVGHDEYAPFRKTDPGRLFDWSRITLPQ